MQPRSRRGATRRGFWSTMGGMETSAAARTEGFGPEPTKLEGVETGVAGTLDLPTDRPRRPERTGRRGRVSLAVGSEIAEVLASTTGAHVLVAAFASLLYRYTNEEVLAIGFVESGNAAC